MTINAFTKLYAIGNGGFGRVWKVRRSQKQTSKYYAMKEMSKARIYAKNSVAAICGERAFLQKLKFPGLINMRYAFQSREYLYIVMDFLSGGDGRYMICRKNYFTEYETKFIAASIILSGEYIHSNHIVHRDGKPENGVFDSKGHLHLTDFGVACEYYLGEEITDTSGTLGYMAPEVINKQAHNFVVDYFALGVIVYELMLGSGPYTGSDRKEIKEQMLTKEIKGNAEDIPYDNDWEDENVIDFLQKLLKRKPQHRLGSRGIQQIKSHPWLREINWDGIGFLQGSSPFTFTEKDNFDDYFANKQEQDEEYKDMKNEYIYIVNSEKFFDNFYFDGDGFKKMKTLSSKDTITIKDVAKSRNKKQRYQSQETNKVTKYTKKTTRRNNSQHNTNTATPGKSRAEKNGSKQQSSMSLRKGNGININ